MAKSKDISLKDSMEELKSILNQLDNNEIDIDRVPELVLRAQQIQRSCEEKLTRIESEINQN